MEIYIDHILYQFCEDKHIEPLKFFAKQFKAVSDFPYTWTLWKNWGVHMPIIALHDNHIVGFHAATLTKTGYINSYYQAVDLSFRGRQIAGNMVDFYLKAWAGNYQRLKLKTPIVLGMTAPGYAFWNGFGLKPFAIDSHNPKHPEHIWNEDLSEVVDIASLISKYKNPKVKHLVPDLAMNFAINKGWKIL